MSLSNLNTKTAPASPTAQPGPAWAARINNGFAQHWLLTFNTAWGIFVTLPWLAPLLMAMGWAWPGRAIYFIYSFFCHQLPERSWFLFGPAFSYTPAQIAQAWDLTLPEISNELIRRQFAGTPELGWKIAWSDRMVALFTSIFLFGLLYALLRQQGAHLKGIPTRLALLFILPLAVDGTTHLINDVLWLDFRDANQWAVMLTGGIFPANFYTGDLFVSLNSILRVASGFLFGLGIVGFLWPLMDREFSPRG